MPETDPAFCKKTSADWLFPIHINMISNMHGLRFACRQSKSPVAYCALSINSGTRDEGAYGGLAHFAEHLLFKGTAHRTATSINNRLERLGGELNAYTTKEDTVIHATVLKEDLPKAIDLLIELAFTSVFPEKEVEKERTVILDEINSYKDAPAEQIFDDFEELLFNGTPLAMPVLGKAASLKKIQRKHIQDYVQRQFRPERMYLTVMGDYTTSQIERMINRSMERHYLHPAISPTSTFDPQTTLSCGDPGVPTAFHQEIRRKGYQTHCILGTSAYSAFDPHRNALILLVNLLGGPAANSRLNTVLREKNALVYSVDASYNAYRDNGCLAIYFGCDQQHYERCLALIQKELDTLCQHRLSERSLQAAKRQFLGQWAISSDNGETQVLAMGKNLLTYGHLLSREEVRSRIEAITAAEIQEVAQTLLHPKRLSLLTYRS